MTAVDDLHFRFDFALAVVVGLVVTTPYVGDRIESLATSIVLVSALMMRRILPTAALVVATVGALGQLVAYEFPLVGIVVVPMIVYSSARWADARIGRAALGLGLAGALLGPTRWALRVGPTTTALIYFAMGVTGCAGIVLAAYLVGRRRREGLENTRERRQSALERSRLTLAEQEQRAAVAAVDERNRIARELHDIVAHSLSVIVVQAEGGRALAAKHPEQAGEVLGTIAETARTALEEMRRMVGLLRSGRSEHEQTSYVPTPGLAEIPELVRRTSDTAELVVFGEAPLVSQALGLTAYRIVQESLTNVLKHGGATATARVTLAFTATTVEIEVTDSGSGAAVPSDGEGHGLQGMAERVALHGGVLHASPRPTGGFCVRASLPLLAEPTVSLGPLPASVVR
ncbi:sensor histidine kinase [uncultured Friedmanniella sp.]|uniref:sensor histidine kinase n=1 Tax=uncultured Friedmanniella sp. TaxID=335381 RepID=UPI0035CA6304